MDCPRCAGASKIEETRTDAAGQRRRYRRCSRCSQRFTTIEALDVGSVLVEKRGGLTEPFSRAKLLKSIRKAAITELPAADLNELVDKIIQVLVVEEFPKVLSDPTPALRSTVIGETVLAVLQDEVRLQAVHVRYALLFEPARGTFTDAESFLQWMSREYPRPPRDVRRFVLPDPEIVVKRDGTLAPFSRAKLEESIRYAAKKKPDEAEALNDRRLGEIVADRVLEQVRHQSIVTSGQLATEVMRVLRTDTIDEKLLPKGERELAYLRVASTAKGFRRADDIRDEARGLVAAGQT